MNAYPPPWVTHTHFWVCRGSYDYCFECGRTQTFQEWLENYNRD